MKNIVLFGGAFDPIHNGHLNMAFFASKQLDADIFFIPAKKSVWKSESALVSDKINMIRLAIKDYPRFFVDTYEADQEKDVTYSIETVTHFVNEYRDTKFYYLIGVDQVNEFHRWKECDQIAKLVQLVFFPRPGFDIKQENVTRFKMLQLDSVNISDAASNKIRTFESLETPLEVINYILDNNLYIAPKIKEYFTEHRYAHCLSVANVAYKIAEKNNYQTPGRAFLAGLFHDINKKMDKEAAVDMMKNECPEYFDMPYWSYHQFLGAVMAKNIFKINDEEILDAIRFHASGKGNMTKLGKIVYAADKIDPLRGYDSNYMIQAMEKDIDEGFKFVLEENIKYLKSQGKNFDNKYTTECINFYLK